MRARSGTVGSVTVGSGSGKYLKDILKWQKDTRISDP